LLAAILSCLAVFSCGGRKREAAANVSFVEEPTGIQFQHHNGAIGKFLMPEIMGAGAALFDFDNDGDLDLFLVQSVGESKLFRNSLVPTGKLIFEDLTAASGIHFAGYGMGAATGDYNNDGYEDLFVTGYDKRSLYRNNGNGTFTELAFPPLPGVWSTSASFFDYDRDGRLDLIVLSYVNWSESTNKACQAPTGEPDYCTPRAYSPAAARLYHNDGGDRFIDVTSRAGIDRALGPGLGVAATDLNDDGWPDLFVANDTAQNHVWINQRDGTFREAGLEAGAAFSEDGLAKAGMGVAVGDADGDGLEDLVVLNLMREGATLFRKESVTAAGLPVFGDISRRSRLYTLTLPYTGFGAGWIDYDNDGVLDLFLANGAVTLREDQRGQKEPYKERNLLLRNEGAKFADVTGEAGSVLQLVEITRGAAFGDVDNDGRVDVLITTNNGPARLLLNRSAAGKWLDVRLQGALGVNRDGLGAHVRVRRQGRPDLVRRVQTDSSYCSASDRRVHFGLGNDEPHAVEVRWPDGSVERWLRPGVKRTINLVKGMGLSN
jgi:hypothetical protein